MDPELAGPILAKAAQPGIEAMLELANERVSQEQAKIRAEWLKIKREKERKRQARCRAKRKQEEATRAPMETHDVHTMSDYHDEDSEEEPPEAMDVHQDLTLIFTLYF